MKNKISYVTLLSTQNYLDGVIVLYKSLRQYSKIPFHCVCSKSLPKRCIEELNNEGINTISLTETAIEMAQITPHTVSGLEHWNYTFDKLLLWGLVQFDKMVFLDSDMMVCSNIDDLFEKDNMSAVQAGRFIYDHWIRLNSGCFVLTPSKETMFLLIEQIKPTIGERLALGYGTGDQDVINRYYCNWPNETSLHLSEEYNVFFMNIPRYKELGLPSPRIVHFVGNVKPWIKKSILAEMWYIVKLCIRHKECLPYYFVYKKILQKK